MNINELRLDARRVVNKLSQKRPTTGSDEEAIPSEKEENEEERFQIPAKLRQSNYFLSSISSTDPEINAAINHINANVNSDHFRKPSKKSGNLSRAEKRGLSWLQKKIEENEVAVCQADKGGAILIVDPDFLVKKVKEKVTDTTSYEELPTDIRPELHNQLIGIWKHAVQNNLVSKDVAKDIVGITFEGNKSSSSRFKYGRTYYVPSLKIHKLKPEELLPGRDIPVRLITCLQEGVTKRSDVYLAQFWLKDLERDFCSDLVKDTTESLSWLEELDRYPASEKNRFTPFTFDFEALYDSLNPRLVLKALREAMDTCRSHWSAAFKDWIIDLVQLSIDASIGEFMGRFFRQLSGLPTGGSLIVEIANISVCYVLKKVLYQDKNMMKGIVSMKRYIDDGIGVHILTRRWFNTWKNKVSAKVSEFGLKIKESDWDTPDDKFGSVNFLDIRFWFDRDRKLQTDLYQKPTDARNYLDFRSCHPSYTFSGVVYSQGIRLRRIINDQERLSERLSEMKADLVKCNYPKKMIDKIFDKVKAMERTLKKKPKKVDADDDSILVVTTYGRDEKLIKTLKAIEKKSENIQFRYAKKTGTSLRNSLVKSKKASLGDPYGKTMPCRKRNCKTCSMVSKKDFVTDPNGKKIYTAVGQCNTRCLIYHASCGYCVKCYTGKTTQPLNGRVSGHRGKFYDCLQYNGDRLDLDVDDDHALGLHLYLQHGVRNPTGFNESYSFTVLERCNPRNIDLKEHLWIQRLKTVKPYGLNSHDPFGFPTTL